jgi:hypothetical protein
MRYGLAFVFVLVVKILLGFSDADAASCRATGDYRVTGPNVVGRLTLTETAVDEAASSGTFLLELFSKQGCAVCQVGVQTLRGDYHVFSDFDGTCFLGLTVRNLGTDLIGSTGGPLAFGGAVIMFDGFGFNGPAPLRVDLNLTLGIRSDAFRP